MPLPLDLAFALGDCAPVLAAPAPAGATDAAVAGHLARARCHLRGEPEPDDARAALVELEHAGGTLAGYVALTRARARVVLGEPVKDLLGGVSLPGPAGAEVALLRAVGDVDALLALAAGPRGPEAQWRAAELARGTARERPILEALYLDARPGGFDVRAEAKLRALGVDLAPLASRRLDALKGARRADEAVALADTMAAPTTAAGWLALGRTRYDGRDYPRALEAWAKVFGPPAESRGDAQPLFDYALAYARTGDYATAAVVYRRVMAQHPGTKQATFAHFKLGYMAWDAADCAAAVPLLEEHAAKYPTSAQLDEALWWRARCAQLTGDDAAAAAAFTALTTQRPKSSLVAGAAYWRLPDGDDAALAKFVTRYPTSAYAWLASARLGRTFPAAEVAPPPTWTTTQATNGVVVRAEALLSAGLRDWARAELDGVKATGRDAALALASAKLRAGDAKGARALACPHAGTPTDATDRAADQLCWPKVEGHLVDTARGSVPPSIVYGVMVAESAMDPDAASAVGARGLMQLMPEVAAGLHGRHVAGGLLSGPFAADDLYVAPYNALLGTTELADRSRSLDGLLTPSSLAAVVASYNAGEEAVVRWAGVDGEAQDAFVEGVGYVETRGYVKRVLGTAMEWRWVWGDPPSGG